MPQYVQSNNTIVLEQFIIERLENEELRKRIKHLPDKYQQVIMYFYFKDLPYGEIATALNISVRTVKARLHREKVLLRKVWAKQGND